MFKLLNTDYKAYAFIVLISSLLFIPFIGNMPLFDWDEINFAECAREMLITNNYSDVQLYFQPFWEKPPMFIWFQAMCMNVFGVSEFAARLPNALCGVITLLVLYKTGKELNDKKFGLTWSFVYASTLLPHLFFKSGIIDPWFNLFIYSSVYQLIKHTNNPVSHFGYKTAIFSGFFLGLALLTKGPAALLLVGLTVAVFFVLGRFKKISSFKFIATFFLAFIITGFSWFAIELLKGNAHVIKEFIDYQIRLFNTEDSDHGGPFIYHFVVLLLGCFPSSIFLILAHKKSESDTPFQIHSKRWMMSLFWVVLILFSIVQTKIVHYSSLCYFPLTYLATYAIQKLLSSQYAWKMRLHILAVSISIIMGILFLLVGLIPFFTQWLITSNLIADQFAVENLKAVVKWNHFEWTIGVVFFIFTLYSLYKIKHGVLKFIYVLFIGSLITVYGLIMVIAPKVEQYSQRTAIDFYKMCALNNFYVETVSFKSYASVFYGEIKSDFKTNPNFISYLNRRNKDFIDHGVDPTTYYSLFYKQWLFEGKIDKPACFVAKITDLENFNTRFPNLKEMWRANGFVFFYRLPDKN
jgi:4-amino-4-deoxy-L-arabinose transferase-like glycosyltransferase